MNPFVKDPTQTISGLLESMFFNLNSVSGQIDTMQVSGGQSYSHRFSVDLTSGVDYLYINFPYTGQSSPIPVCEIENNEDNLIYNYCINNVTNSGFGVKFSDILSNSYRFHVNY